MQEVLGVEGETESCEDEIIAMEPSSAEPENEQPELQPQVGKSCVFLTVLPNHCFHIRGSQTRIHRGYLVLQGTKKYTVAGFCVETNVVLAQVNFCFVQRVIFNVSIEFRR